MTNVLAGRTYVLDTNDIISRVPICVQRVVFVPTAAGSVCLFNWYDRGNPIATGTGQGTATITSNTTITATTSVLPSTIVDGSVFDILGSNGAVANIGPELVTTAGTNTVVVCAQAGWTNEATIVYSFKTYPQYVAIYLKAGASDASAVTISFENENGRWVDNLTLETIAGTA